MDSEDAIVALRREAAAGDARAQLNLAWLSITQRPGAPPLNEGERLLAEACAQDFSDAFLFQAVLSMRGIGRRKSLDDAYAFVKRSAALGNASAQAQLGVLGVDALDKAPWLKPIKLDPVAEAPRIFFVENFIPPSVCNWLVSAGRGRLTPALVLHDDGRATPDPIRTNRASSFAHTQGDLVVQSVCRRIATATGTPLSHHEPASLLHYLPGQRYVPHYDFLPLTGIDAQDAARGQRVATALLYLNDQYDGGATYFPRLNLSFKGKTGDALIFWNVSETGELEKNSLHAGNPVLAGEKWLLSQWIRERPQPLT